MPRAISPAVAEAFAAGSEQFDVVLTLDSAGAAWHVAETPFSVAAGDDGADVQVDGGLLAAPEIPSRAASVRDAGVSLGGDVSVSLMAEAATWRARLATRFPVQQMGAELALLPRTGTWADRLVFHAGIVRSPAWDLRAGTLALSIAQAAPDAAGRLPDRVVSLASMGASVPERSLGQPMPILYGSTVYDVAGIVLQEAADDNWILIAGHHVRTTAAAITVHRDGPDGAVADVTATAVNDSDLWGRPISYFVLSDADYWQDNPTNTRPYSICFDAPGRAGGVIGSASFSEFRMLGEVLLDVLQTYGQLTRVDVDSFRLLDSVLPIEVSAQVTQEKDAVDWARTLAQDLPVAVEWVGGLLRALAAPLHADREPAVAARLVYGRELLELTSPFEEESIENVANDVIVKFAYRNREGNYIATVELNALNDAACQESVRRYGHRALDQSVELQAVQDPASAFRIAREFVARRAHLRTRCAYTAESRAVSHLEPLDVVEVTDEDQGVVAQMFLVEEILPGADGATVLALASRAELEVTT